MCSFIHFDSMTPVWRMQMPELYEDKIKKFWKCKNWGEKNVSHVNNAVQVCLKTATKLNLSQE